jgi:hypothetical protein
MGQQSTRVLFPFHFCPRVFFSVLFLPLNIASFLVCYPVRKASVAIVVNAYCSSFLHPNSKSANSSAVHISILGASSNASFHISLLHKHWIIGCKFVSTSVKHTGHLSVFLISHFFKMSNVFIALWLSNHTRSFASEDRLRFCIFSQFCIYLGNRCLVLWVFLP